MAIHQPPPYAPPTQPPAYGPSAQPPPPPPAPVEHAGRRRRSGIILTTVALVVAVAAAIMSGIALARGPVAAPAANPQPVPATPSAPAPTPAEVAAAKQAACTAWDDASKAMVTARQPFLDAPLDWANPVTIAALSQAQSGILVQVEYLRQQLGPATPPDVTAGINEFNKANIDLVALDGQHQPAAAANAAADRSNAAAKRLRAACGL